MIAAERNKTGEVLSETEVEDKNEARKCSVQDGELIGLPVIGPQRVEPLTREFWEYPVLTGLWGNCMVTVGASVSASPRQCAYTINLLCRVTKEKRRPLNLSTSHRLLFRA